MVDTSLQKREKQSDTLYSTRVKEGEHRRWIINDTRKTLAFLTPQENVAEQQGWQSVGQVWT